MLTPDFLTDITKQTVGIYTQLELEIIEQIAKRIAKVGYANTIVQNNAIILQEMGVLQKDIITLVARYNNVSEETIKNAFLQSGIKTLEFDDKIYKKAGLNPIPIKQSKNMLQLLTSTAVKTNRNLNNLVLTTANTVQMDFINTMNKAYLEVSSGVKSYSQAITESIKELSKKNTLVEYPSGYKTSIENAVRMNTKTGISQTCGKLQEMRADELDWDLMEITAHGGARPEHAEWQGKIVSRSGRKGYLSLDDIGYGTVTGFKGVNCGHDWYPYYKGSTRTYTDKELKELKNETIMINDKNVSKYEASQIQRQYERQLRTDKKEIKSMQSILLNTKDNELYSEIKRELQNTQIKYKQHNKEFNDFLSKTRLKKDNTRLVI